MALGKCPECGHDMSSDAGSCPNCGWKRAGTKIDEVGSSIQGCGTTLTIFVTIPIILICIFMGL